VIKNRALDPLADFAALGADIARVEGGRRRSAPRRRHGRTVRAEHHDRAPVVAAIRKRTRLALDVHLDDRRAGAHIPEFVAAGADIVTVHLEACPHLARTLAQIRELGARRAWR